MREKLAQSVNVFNIQEPERNYYQKQFVTCSNKADVYAFFIERCLENLLTKKGVLGFITSKTWMSIQSFFNFRTYLIEKTRIIQIAFVPERAFIDALVETALIFVMNDNPQQQILFVDLNEKGVLDSNLANLNSIKADTNHIFTKSSRSTKSTAILFRKMSEKSIKLRYLGAMSLGIKTADNDRFVSTINNEMFNRPVLRGRDIDRYDLQESGLWMWYAPSKMMERVGAGFRKAENFLVAKKICLQEISKDRIIASIDYNQLFPLDTANVIYQVKQPHQYSLEYLLSLLNSSIINYWYGVQYKGIHVKLNELEQIPIYRISFTTPPEERTRLLEKAKGLYAHCMTKDEPDCVTGFVEHHLTMKPEQSDVVHDLLSFLAEKMLRLNKEKRTAQHQFMDWLVTTLKILPDKEGREGIDVLTGKAKLVDYPGDYQKGESPLAFEESLDILRKNKGRLGVSLSDAGLVDRVRIEYEGSLERVLPLKERLAKTDALIDQVAYRLYGLTEEEIEVVEGKG